METCGQFHKHFNCVTYNPSKVSFKANVHWRSSQAKMLATVTDGRQTMYLPWPPWAAPQKIEMIQSL